MARKIKCEGFKVLLNKEGGDRFIAALLASYETICDMHPPETPITVVASGNSIYVMESSAYEKHINL